MKIKNILSPRKRAAASRASNPGKNDEHLTVAITGGSGFLGRHIVEHVREDFDEGTVIRVMDIRVPDSEDRVKGVEYVACDLRKYEDVQRAIRGANAVIHTATAAPTGSNAYNMDLMRSVNVDGTRHVVDACVQHGVRALVYTSSASVVFEGKDLFLVDEDTPYASKPLDFYTETKIEGEKIALDGCGGKLPACALRPSGIFGEYDQLTVPTIVDKAKAGKSKYIIGDGKNMMDWTYAGNIAQAHVLAAIMLLRDGRRAPCAGKAYFITNDDPRPFWGMMGDICEGLGYGRPRIHLPYHLIMAVAYVVQYLVVPLARVFGKKLEPDFTPFRVAVSATNRTFSCKRAKKDLGYVPRVTTEQALEKTFVFFKHLKNSK
jgi:sterol-4alpha-carboxylate 3-dehydrogenase (decarboxylating)